MRTNKIALAGLGIAMAFGLTAGTGLAQATTHAAAAHAAQAVTPACAAAILGVTNAHARLNEAIPTRNLYGNQVKSEKAARQSAINAGNVELVGKINVQLGSSTAFYNTMDGEVAAAQAQLVRSNAAEKAAC